MKFTTVQNNKENTIMRDTLIEFLDDLRDYVAESGTNIAQDERDSSEFVDVFLDKSKILTIDSVNPRFIVDERIGCIAIRDTKHPEFKGSKGLTQDMPDVVAFEIGTKIDTGGFTSWDLDPNVVKSFNNRCSILNEG